MWYNRRISMAYASFFCVIGNFVPITQKRSARMRTAAYNADVASDRRRRKNVPRHILCSCNRKLCSYYTKTLRAISRRVIKR